MGGAQRYFSVRMEDTADMNLSQAAWTSAVKSAGKRAASVTSRQWDRSCGDREGGSGLSAGVHMCLRAYVRACVCVCVTPLPRPLC